MKKFSLVLLCIVLVLSMVACASDSSQSSPSAAPSGDSQPDSAVDSSEPADAGSNGDGTFSDKVFRAAMTATPQSLDEGYSTNAHTRQVSSYIFETLFTFGESFEVIPQLADSYTLSDDSLEAVITLREGVKFHDGSDFTAEDVIASIERYKTTMQYGNSLDAIANMEATSDYEIKFTLSAPIGLPPLLAFPQRVLMLPKEVAERNMGTELKGEDVIGTGPYMLAEWTPDVHVKLERFDDYAIDERYDAASGLGGKRIAYFKTIYLLPVTEAESRMAGLETGEFDYAEAIPNTSYDRISSNSELTVSIVKPKWSIALELNHTNWPTNDVNFKKALVYALDMEKVLQAVTSSNPEFYRLDPSIYTPEQFYFTEAGSAGIYNTQDLDKVKELLAAANYNGEEIVYLVNRDFDFMYKACLSLAEQWQAAGINIKLEFSDWATQISKAQSMEGWNINQTGLSARLDPTQLNSHLNPQSAGAYGFENEEVIKLMAEIGMGKPEAERKEIWEQIQTKIWDEVAFIKVGDYFEMEAINVKYEGFQSFYLQRFWNVEEK